MDINTAVTSTIQHWSWTEWRDVVYAARRPDGTWIELPLDRPPALRLKWEGVRMVDLYFAPLAYLGKRTNQNAAGFGCLFADLDPVDPRALPIQPSVAWETSPGSYQAVWRLSDGEDLSYTQWADLNKRMTYHIGADRGGWMGSKVLRVPETLNFKRFDEITGVAPRGRLVIEAYAMTYSAREMNAELPTVSALGAMAGDHPALPSNSAQWRELIRSRWTELPALVQSMLLTPQVRDRSFTITKAARALAEAGWSPRDTFMVLAGAPWNKFEGRPHVLWGEVLKAYPGL